MEAHVEGRWLTNLFDRQVSIEHDVMRDGIDVRAIGRLVDEAVTGHRATLDAPDRRTFNMVPGYEAVVPAFLPRDGRVEVSLTHALHNGQAGDRNPADLPAR